MTPGGSISPHWRALHAERLEEAVALLGAVPGVRGLVLGGSVATGEHWPLSDIDILPIWKSGAIDDDAMSRAQAQMVDWWAASGRAQTLDVSWLQFDDAEVVSALKSGPQLAAEQMSDLRWFHGLDKMYGGVDMEFVADDTANNLSIKAESADFVYDEADKTRLVRILLKGEVIIQSQQNEIRSQEADIDFDSGEATFTGKPTMEGEQFRDVKTSLILINLDTGDYKLDNATGVINPEKPPE